VGAAVWVAGVAVWVAGEWTVVVTGWAVVVAGWLVVAAGWLVVTAEWLAVVGPCDVEAPPPAGRAAGAELLGAAAGLDGADAFGLSALSAG